MSARLAIWTVQRTGGTNLTDALADRYGLPVPPAIEGRPHTTGPHEPFERERVYGAISRSWGDTGDRAALRRAVAEVADRGVFFKHCVDTAPLPVSAALAAATARRGYAHLVLHRRSALDRLLSFHHARRTHRWFPGPGGPPPPPEELPIEVAPLVAREERARRRLAKVVLLLERNGARPVFVAFEDVFVAPDGAEALVAVIEALGMSRGRAEDLALAEEVRGRGAMRQAERYAALPGVDALRDALAGLVPFGPDTLAALAEGGEAG